MRLRFPHPLTLLVGFIVLVALLSWVLPAGQFDRRDDPVTGRKVVVAGTYHSVPQQPVTPFQAVVAIQKGKADAAVLVPLSDLLGLSRQVTVLAYQYGRGAERHTRADQRRVDGDSRLRRYIVRYSFSA
jgi:uncharacterized ion transporter superfamily protein YfcC